MTQKRKEALIKVRDGVKAGDELDGFTVSCAFPNWKPMEKWSLMQLLEWACDPTDIRAMGAAKALHNAVLPGWAISRLTDWPSVGASCEIWGTHEGKDGERWHHHTDGRARADAHPLARVWLLAILEALIAQEPDT